jgi:hypothetical protein
VTAARRLLVSSSRALAAATAHRGDPDVVCRYALRAAVKALTAVFLARGESPGGSTISEMAEKLGLSSLGARARELDAAALLGEAGTMFHAPKRIAWKKAEPVAEIRGGIFDDNDARAAERGARSIVARCTALVRGRAPSRADHRTKGR